MKATLEFDIENTDWEIAEREQRKLKCAQKGWEMSGFIDSFLDYLIVVGPHIPMNEILDKITDMYHVKLEEYDVIDVLEPDMQKVVNTWMYNGECEDEAHDIMQKMKDEYIENKLEKLTKTSKPKDKK